MGELQVAANNFKSVGVTLRKFIAVADELERIGSIEQAAAEAQTRLDGLRTEETELIGSIARKRADAERELAGHRDEADRRVDETRGVLAELDRQIAARRTEFEQLSQDLGTKRAEHDLVTREHAEFLARVGALQLRTIAGGLADDGGQKSPAA